MGSNGLRQWCVLLVGTVAMLRCTLAVAQLGTINVPGSGWKRLNVDTRRHAIRWHVSEPEWSTAGSQFATYDVETGAWRVTCRWKPGKGKGRFQHVAVYTGHTFRLP